MAHSDMGSAGSNPTPDCTITTSTRPIVSASAAVKVALNADIDEFVGAMDIGPPHNDWPELAVNGTRRFSSATSFKDDNGFSEGSSSGATGAADCNGITLDDTDVLLKRRPSEDEEPMYCRKLSRRAITVLGCDPCDRTDR